MARKKRQKKKAAIRFELGLGGVLAVGVVCFCIFLWMFLLGIWAGQTVLQGKCSRSRPATGVGVPSRSGFASIGELAGLVRGGTADEEAEPQYAGATFFTLQVGAFAGERKAIAAVAAWRARDYDTFYAAPAGRESRYRVFIGRYDTLERANEAADAFTARNSTSAYITLLDEKDVVEP